MTARMTEVEVQIMNYCGFGDDHRGPVTGQQMATIKHHGCCIALKKVE